MSKEWFEEYLKTETPSKLSFRPPGPLEGCPGSEAYFVAVMASMRREMASKVGPFAERAEKKAKLSKVVVTHSESDGLSPQYCDGCGRWMESEPCKATSKYPYVFCLVCAPSLENSRCENLYGALVEAAVTGREMIG